MPISVSLTLKTANNVSYHIVIISEDYVIVLLGK